MAVEERIEEGGAYVPNRTTVPSRRVVAVIGERVAYSRGGDTTMYCSAHTFRRWMRENNAQDLRGQQVRLSQMLDYVEDRA